MSYMNEIEEELRWAREALATNENQNFSYKDAHELRFPTRFCHFLDWDENRLENHVDRLERDLRNARARE